MKRKIPVQQLRLGMYVDELDCPWLETPFLFQGFPIHTQHELELLQKHCQNVYILDESETWNKPIQKNSHRFQTIQINRTDKPAAQKRNHNHQTFIDDLKNIKATYDQSRCYIGEVLKDVRLGKHIDIHSGKALVQNFTESIIQNDNVLVLLSQLKKVDEYTVRHSLNVCIFSLLLSKHIDLGPDDMQQLGLGALLHDIGKMKLPKTLVNKAGPLTAEEKRLVKTHPEEGYRILSKMQNISWETLHTVRDHHERIDGSGYPKKRKEDALGLFAKIVSIVDVYDAITTQRAYHDAISPHEALKLMYEHTMGTFPEDLLEQFIHCLSIFPIGSIVELDSGEIAIVVAVNREQHLFPTVLLVLDEEKQPYMPRKLCNLQLMKKSERPLRIKKILESSAFEINVADILLDEGNFDSLAVE